jgi:hypothetical protein
LEINTMMSPKLAVLMTTLALVGAVSPALAAATSDRGDDDPSNSVSVERNNEIEQSNDIEQYACTNEQDNEAENEDGDDQVAVVAGGNQSNDCVVVQAATANNTGAIVDGSTNNVTAALANLNVDDSILAGLGL